MKRHLAAKQSDVVIVRILCNSCGMTLSPNPRPKPKTHNAWRWKTALEVINKYGNRKHPVQMFNYLHQSRSNLFAVGGSTHTFVSFVSGRAWREMDSSSNWMQNLDTRFKSMGTITRWTKLENEFVTEKEKRSSSLWIHQSNCQLQPMSRMPLIYWATMRPHADSTNLEMTFGAFHSLPSCLS